MQRYNHLEIFLVTQLFFRAFCSALDNRTFRKEPLLRSVALDNADLRKYAGTRSAPMGMIPGQPTQPFYLNALQTGATNTLTLSCAGSSSHGLAHLNSNAPPAVECHDRSLEISSIISETRSATTLTSMTEGALGSVGPSGVMAAPGSLPQASTTTPISLPASNVSSLTRKASLTAIYSVGHGGIREDTGFARTCIEKSILNNDHEVVENQRALTQFIKAKASLCLTSLCTSSQRRQSYYNPSLSFHKSKYRGKKKHPSEDANLSQNHVNVVRPLPLSTATAPLTRTAAGAEFVAAQPSFPHSPDLRIHHGDHQAPAMMVQYHSCQCQSRAPTNACGCGSRYLAPHTPYVYENYPSGPTGVHSYPFRPSTAYVSATAVSPSTTLANPSNQIASWTPLTTSSAASAPAASNHTAQKHDWPNPRTLQENDPLSFCETSPKSPRFTFNTCSPQGNAIGATAAAPGRMPKDNAISYSVTPYITDSAAVNASGTARTLAVADVTSAIQGQSNGGLIEASHFSSPPGLSTATHPSNSYRQLPAFEFYRTARKHHQKRGIRKGSRGIIFIDQIGNFPVHCPEDMQHETTRSMTVKKWTNYSKNSEAKGAQCNSQFTPTTRLSIPNINCNSSTLEESGKESSEGMSIVTQTELVISSETTATPATVCHDFPRGFKRKRCSLSPKKLPIGNRSLGAEARSATKRRSANHDASYLCTISNGNRLNELTASEPAFSSEFLWLPLPTTGDITFAGGHGSLVVPCHENTQFSSEVTSEDSVSGNICSHTDVTSNASWSEQSTPISGTTGENRDIPTFSRVPQPVSDNNNDHGCDWQC